MSLKPFKSIKCAMVDCNIWFWPKYKAHIYHSARCVFRSEANLSYDKVDSKAGFGK